MGVGANIAHGCNIGLGLAGLPTLSLGSLLAVACMTAAALAVRVLALERFPRIRGVRFHPKSMERWPRRKGLITSRKRVPTGGAKWRISPTGHRPKSNPEGRAPHWGRNLPHYHHRPGIGRHRSWEGGL